MGATILQKKHILQHIYAHTHILSNRASYAEPYLHKKYLGILNVSTPYLWCEIYWYKNIDRRSKHTQIILYNIMLALWDLCLSWCLDVWGWGAFLCLRILSPTQLRWLLLNFMILAVLIFLNPAPSIPNSYSLKWLFKNEHVFIGIN